MDKKVIISFSSHGYVQRQIARALNEINRT